MSDPTKPAATVRPMTAADYAAGTPAPTSSDHPTRDLMVGAVVGAFALWAVPKIMDALTGGIFASDDGSETYDLEVDE